MNIYTDNNELVRRMKEREIPLNPNETLYHEYDTTNLLWDIRDIVPVSFQFVWIKSHQDKNKQGDTIYGPHKRPIQLNMDMDLQANIGRQMNSLCETNTNTKTYKIRKLI